MNRTTHTLNSINTRLGQIQGLNILRVWRVDKCFEYDFPYCYARILGEQAGITNEYENGSGSNEDTTPSIEIVIGYSIDRDTDGEGLFAQAEAELVHKIRQWLDNPEWVVEDYADLREQVFYDSVRYTGYNGVTEDATETKGVSAMGFVVNFQAVKNG